MPRRGRAPCLGCGTPTPRRPAWCDTCWPNSPRARRTRGRAGVNLRRQAIADHLASFGPICPGWNRDPHRVPPADLTVDHITPLALGGTDEPSNLRVLCSRCNASRGTSVG